MKEAAKGPDPAQGDVVSPRQAEAALSALNAAIAPGGPGSALPVLQLDTYRGFDGRGVVVSVYDGDTVRVMIEKRGAAVIESVRIIGFNSEEIKDKSYSVLGTPKAPLRTPLERALAEFFKRPKAREALRHTWGNYSDEILRVHDLWFRRVNALVAKYALYERFETARNQVRVVIEDDRRSFQRILAHLYFADSGESVCDWMIARRYGYRYHLKSNSEQYQYSDAEKLQLWARFADLSRRHLMTFSAEPTRIGDH